MAFTLKAIATLRKHFRATAANSRVGADMLRLMVFKADDYTAAGAIETLLSCC
jgi:hypothetical protein